MSRVCCRLHVEISRDVSDLDIVCVIGQGRPSRPMMCLRYRSATLRMFSTTIVAIASEAIKTEGYIFKGNIFDCKILYRYHNIFALKSRISASFPHLQTLILAISKYYIGLISSQLGSQ